MRVCAARFGQADWRFCLSAAKGLARADERQFALIEELEAELGAVSGEPESEA